ncbi:Cytochrome P450 CYP4/CYP19/CYP26 subfamily [Handroanthus impetiginosus]|uniref:Cytochrome P450 CYP4/CYP19/CYP26 subfamily n=1 Tax=Handroanthus impetiginosus TaxID=429701 RepID=A0A2G9HE80_9LAMI|nr:Cytochrome P450 CYP4/CYP19/CYP26 subfamily [Handroanthus impetiginosus]
MHTSLKEGLQFLINNYGAIILSSLIAIGIAVLLRQKGDDRRSGGIPGKLGIPLLGETFSFLASTNSTKGCYDFVRQRRMRHGNWFKTRILGRVHVFVPSVEGAKTIFANDFVLFNKGYLKSMADAVGKKSLLSVPQEIHQRIRGLLSDPFSMNSVSKFIPKFDSELCERLKRLEEEGKSFRVLEFTMKDLTSKERLMQVAFDGICDMLLSITDASTLGQLERDITAVADSMLSFPIMIPGTRYYKGMKARERVMKTFKAMISKRRSREEAPDDFLQSMLQRDLYPPNEKLDDEEILDNLLTLIIAGQSTTAAAIMWCVKFLDDNREVQDRLREEQLSILGNKPAGTLLKYEDLMNMSYASKVVKETLRMSNVLLWYPRVALDNCTIEGYEIKKGWNVNIDATHIHYDPAIYENPMYFKPSRFDEMQKPYSYIPFGSGPRTCLGINMAKVTMLVFLHRLTSGYTWTVDNQDLSLERKAHIPRLQSGCPITLQRLDNRNA